jgi:hypothetical protein
VFFSEALVKEGIEDGQRRQQEGKNKARVAGLNWARGKVEEGDAQASRGEGKAEVLLLARSTGKRTRWLVFSFFLYSGFVTNETSSILF